MNYMTADEAVRLVKSGDTVCCQGSTSVPVLLQEALARRADELRDVQIVSGFNITEGPAPFCKPEYKDSFLINSIFVCADQRKHIAQGYGSMTPSFLSEVPYLFRSGLLPIDVAFINCSLPDENGFCSSTAQSFYSHLSRTCEQIQHTAAGLNMLRGEGRKKHGIYSKTKVLRTLQDL